uniref:CBF domain-containing protein n=1 Tax=Rhabditophanes sp. KR3021 TaxID=114890 RepID=A0AC35TUG8_9BILA
MVLKVPKKTKVAQAGPDFAKSKELLLKINIASINPETGSATKSTEFNAFFEQFIQQVLAPTSQKDVLYVKKMTKKVFCHKDMFLNLLEKVQVLAGKQLSKVQLSNYFQFLKNLTLPSKLEKSLVKDEFKVVGDLSKENLELLFQASWMILIKKQLSRPLAREVLPFITDHRLDEFLNPELWGDFYFAYYNQGGVYSVLALNGLLKLVVKYNFEYPDFYVSVYKLTSSFILYAKYAEEYISVLNIFLSSTHVPLYIIAAFVKKLARVCLLAPVSALRPILTILQNLLTRFSGLRKMIHNDTCDSIENDPYIEDCYDLKKCKALESCLWEIKPLQSHWLPLICKKAGFIDRNIGTHETPYQWKPNDELFQILLNKKTGTKAVDDDDYTLKNVNKFEKQKFVPVKRKMLIEEEGNAKKLMKLSPPSDGLFNEMLNYCISDLYVL